MPIHAQAPREAFDAVAQRIIDAGADLAFTRASRPAAASRALSLSVPHRIAHLSLERIRTPQAKLRDATILPHWRYLVLEERTGNAERPIFAVIAAAVAVPAEGGYRFGSWSESDLITGMEAAIRAAERRFEQVQAGDYEPLLLFAPEVQVTAVWLRDRRRADNEDSDLILPLPYAEPYQPMKPSEFLDQLRQEAERLPPPIDTA